MGQARAVCGLSLPDLFVARALLRAASRLISTLALYGCSTCGPIVGRPLGRVQSGASPACAPQGMYHRRLWSVAALLRVPVSQFAKVAIKEFGSEETDV